MSDAKIHPALGMGKQSAAGAAQLVCSSSQSLYGDTITQNAFLSQLELGARVVVAFCLRSSCSYRCEYMEAT